MDSEHRHDLKENDLAEFVRHFGQFWEKWGNTLLMGVLVVLLVVVANQYWRDRTVRLREEAWGQLHEETSPAGLKDLAENTGNKTVKALASLQAADLLMSGNGADQAGPTTAPAVKTEEQKQQDLADAEQLYQAVLDQAEVGEVIRLNARLGLASVAEAKKSWDQARKLYQQVIADAEAAKQEGLAIQARGRLAMLDRLSEPMPFAPEPVAADTAATQPSP
ncbi:MAG: tetratricopeptide repeat protein [Phycisphaeraceae bacterium]|nr:tetratricopeptide repeat protein [Phycisphaeraceae bacterium]